MRAVGRDWVRKMETVGKPGHTCWRPSCTACWMRGVTSMSLALPVTLMMRLGLKGKNKMVERDLAWELVSAYRP